jgi:hypothetical protein
MALVVTCCLMLKIVYCVALFLLAMVALCRNDPCEAGVVQKNQSCCYSTIHPFHLIGSAAIIV